MKRALLTAVVTTILFRRADAGPFDYSKSVAGPCDAASSLEHYRRETERKLLTAAQTAKDALIAAAKATLAGNQLDAAGELSAKLLAAELHKQAVGALDSLTTNWETTLTGLSTEAKMEGQQELLNDLLNVQLDSEPATLVATSLGAKPLAIQANLQGTGNKLCYKTPGEKDLRQEMPRGRTSTRPTITVFAAEAIPKAATANGPNTFCGTAGAASVDKLSSCGNSQAAAGFIGGKILKKKALSLTKKSTDSGAHYEDVSTEAIIPNKETLNDYAKKLTASEASLPKSIEAAQDNAEAIATSATVKDAIARKLGGPDASYSTKTKEVDDFIEKTFGKDASKVKEQLNKNLKDMIPSKEADQGDGKTKLENLNDINKLIKAHHYYAIKNYIADQENKKKNRENPSCPTKTQKAAESPKTADECKKHTTSEDCEKEKGCDFDDKKPEGERCFPKAETAKKDEKSFSGKLRVSVSQVFAGFVALLF
uniref:Variant surface glycoprotein 1125.372 n=1 Tax=Trypanosoma brucei TaxID=5691 RepID=A0A1J0R498_9TRYP|nr:variant surface glycoprotein 1125.372 [Trypanosoma brucei]